jgi:hypothetical protein
VPVLLKTIALCASLENPTVSANAFMISDALHIIARLPRLSTLSIAHSREPEVSPIPWVWPADSRFRTLSSLHLGNIHDPNPMICHISSHIPPYPVSQCTTVLVDNYDVIINNIMRKFSSSTKMLDLSLYPNRNGNTYAAFFTRSFLYSRPRLWWISVSRGCKPGILRIIFVEI